MRESVRQDSGVGGRHIRRDGSVKWTGQSVGWTSGANENCAQILFVSEINPFSCMCAMWGGMKTQGGARMVGLFLWFADLPKAAAFEHAV